MIEVDRPFTPDLGNRVLHVGDWVVAIRPVTEDGEPPGDENAVFPDPQYIHAVMGQMGMVVHVTADNLPTVRFVDKGTATIVGGRDVVLEVVGSPPWTKGAGSPCLLNATKWGPLTWRGSAPTLITQQLASLPEWFEMPPGPTEGTYLSPIPPPKVIPAERYVDKCTACSRAPWNPWLFPIPTAQDQPSPEWNTLEGWKVWPPPDTVRHVNLCAQCMVGLWGLKAGPWVGPD